MTKYLVYAALAVLLAVPAISSAATVTLTGIDALGTSSFNAPGLWDNATAPSAGNDYFVPNATRLRTPADGGSYSFAGDSLTINNNTPYGDGLMYKGTGNTGTITINNLIFDGGLLSHANGTADICNLDGAITVASGGARFYAKQGPMHIYAPISGSSSITNQAGDSATEAKLWLHSSSNTFTGNIVNNGRLELVDNANLNFVIGASGVNNSFSDGAGQQHAIFDGDFVFDLTGAGTTLADSWQIVDTGSATYYGTNFTVVGFLDNDDGTWFLDNGSGKYKYYEDTGVLEVVNANVIPISVANITPADGSTVYQPQPTISITLLDGNFDAVVTGSIAMTVGGGSVTPSVTSPGSGTNVVSYTPASPLAPGSISVQVTFDDNSANSFTNSWSFTVHPTTTEKLWNINIAGSSSGVLRPVSDGVIAVAPSAGANLWNNVAGVNSSLNTFSINDANGVNTIGYETSGAHNWGESTANGMTVEMFQGWTGANAPMNMTNTLTGLDPGNAYDIYVYSTWRWTQNAVNYNIIEGYADVTSGTITEVQANVQNAASNDYSGCVYGENYIIFTNVTPTASGRIAFTGVSTDGVISGLQVLEIPGAGNVPELLVGGSVPADGARFVSDTPTLTAYFLDVDETVNPAGIAMTIDGSAVSASYAYSNPTSSVSYTVASPFDPGTTHTVKVVVASTPSGTLYTNEWSFTVAPAPGNKVYVDATTTNTLEWNGSIFSTFTPDGNLTVSNWTTRTFGNNGQVYQSLTGICRRLKTTVSGLPSGTYDVYAYMWVQGNDWRIEAALTNNLSGELPLYKRTDYPANTLLSVPWTDYALNPWPNFATAVPTPYYSTNLLVNPFASGSVMVAEADRRLMEVYLGQVTGTEFTVYVDDDPVVPGDRTWYDGVGYEAVTGGPTLDPVIQSIIVSGGTVSLTWTSEATATYSILRKTSLSAPTWTAVKTGIAGGTPSTSDSVPVGGSDQEFFSIEGN